MDLDVPMDVPHTTNGAHIEVSHFKFKTKTECHLLAKEIYCFYMITCWLNQKFAAFENNV